VLAMPPARSKKKIRLNHPEVHYFSANADCSTQMFRVAAGLQERLLLTSRAIVACSVATTLRHQRLPVLILGAAASLATMSSNMSARGAASRALALVP